MLGAKMCRSIFYMPENADAIDLSGFDCIVDAIDTVTAKLHLIQTAKALGVPIISTNLDLPALSKTYHERILSRLIGSYTMLGFVGRDIRQQKLSRTRGEAGI